MPDVFENYFAHFGKKPSDYYDLVRLDPSYTVIYGENDLLDIPADLKEFKKYWTRSNPGRERSWINFWLRQNTNTKSESMIW